MTDIWEHERNVENTYLELLFFTSLQCSQMSWVFYHSVIHGLGFFICFMLLRLCGENIKRRFFNVLYSDKTLVFDQSARVLGLIYVMINNDITSLYSGYIQSSIPLYSCQSNCQKTKYIIILTKSSINVKK